MTTLPLPPPPPRPASHGAQALHLRRSGLLLAVWITLFYVFTAGGSLTTTDALVTYELTRQMVEHGTVALPDNMLGHDAHRGIDGRYYSPFGIAQSVANVPFFLAGRSVERLGLRVGTADSMTKAAVAMGNTIVMAATICLVYLFGTMVTGSGRAGLATALLAGVATPLWPYSKFGFNAPLSALFLTAAAFSAWRSTRDSQRSAVWSGVWVGLALLTRHELILAVVPLVAFFWLSARPESQWLRQVARLGSGLLPALIIWLSYNLWRFGNPLDAGYLRDAVPGFGSSLPEGLYGLLLSPSASLLVYCPVALAGMAGVAGLWKRDRALAVLLGGNVAAMLLFYAQLGNWMGGRSYGPRYLVPVLPLLCIGLAPLVAHKRGLRWLAAIAAVSVVVQLPGVLVDYAKVSVAHARAAGAPSRAERLTDWQTSALVMNARASIRLLPANVAWLIGTSPRPAPVGTNLTGRGEFSQQFAYSLDFWWMYLFHMRVLSANGVAGVVLGFVAGLSTVLVASWRSVPLCDSWRQQPESAVLPQVPLQ